MASSERKTLTAQRVRELALTHKVRPSSRWHGRIAHHVPFATLHRALAACTRVRKDARQHAITEGTPHRAWGDAFSPQGKRQTYVIDFE